MYTLLLTKKYDSFLFYLCKLNTKIEVLRVVLMNVLFLPILKKKKRNIPQHVPAVPLTIVQFTK